MPSRIQPFSRLALVASLAAMGCGDVGQSGSEVIPPPDIMNPGSPMIAIPHCPCGGLRQYQHVRATVVGIEAFPAVGSYRYELIANELLGPDPADKHEIGVGDHFGGYWNGSLGCGGLLPTPVAKGDDVLAFFRRGMQDGQLCCEYLACADPCRTGQDDPMQAKQSACEDACTASNATACAKHQPEAILHGELMLTPWGDSFVVGRSEQASASITRDQLPVLDEDYAQCKADLPDLFPTLYPASFSSAGDKVPSGEKSSASTDAGVAAPVPPTPSTPPSPVPVPPKTDAGMAQDPGIEGPGALPPAAGSAMTNGASSATPPVAGSGAAVNSTSVGAPPPAGPEEIRVRCAVK